MSDTYVDDTVPMYIAQVNKYGVYKENVEVTEYIFKIAQDIEKNYSVQKESWLYTSVIST